MVTWAFVPGAPQTSAHAEMDLYRQRAGHVGGANLRSRGDGLFLVDKGNFPPPNLRSRGDGPSPLSSTHFSYSKPPLTRRWTHRESDLSTVQVQTSAHAEMDPLSRLRCSLKATNLRSRGDGPKRATFAGRKGAKPPLTRRWTYFIFFTHSSCKQTSAHAEMDPGIGTGVVDRLANLRSRGDGPIRWRRRIRPASKPPLTRRWTPYPGQPAGLGAQTSAHAEMDRDIVCSTAHMMANLRSRGDGPPRQSGQAVPCYKPPLTRRWTQPRRGFVLR